MQIKPIKEITEFLEKIATPMGIEIVEVEWNDKSASLTVYIETETGVDLDTCEKFHNAILDPLNVSSPGLDRPFKTARDFERNLQKEVEVKLYAPLRGRKFIEGVLTDFDDNSISLEVNKVEIKISRNKIAKINKAIKFD